MKQIHLPRADPLRSHSPEHLSPDYICTMPLSCFSIVPSSFFFFLQESPNLVISPPTSPFVYFPLVSPFRIPSSRVFFDGPPIILRHPRCCFPWSPEEGKEGTKKCPSVRGSTQQMRGRPRSSKTRTRVLRGPRNGRSPRWRWRAKSRSFTTSREMAILSIPISWKSRFRHPAGYFSVVNETTWIIFQKFFPLFFLGFYSLFDTCWFWLRWFPSDWRSFAAIFPDVINRLNCVRGQGMANLYSWSSKRYVTELTNKRSLSPPIWSPLFSERRIARWLLGRSTLMIFLIFSLWN